MRYARPGASTFGRLLVVALVATVGAACDDSPQNPAAPTVVVPDQPPVAHDTSSEDPPFPFGEQHVAYVRVGEDDLAVIDDPRCAYHTTADNSIDPGKPVFATGTSTFEAGNTPVIFEPGDELVATFRHRLDDGDAFGPGEVTSFEFVMSRDGQVIDRLLARGRVTDDAEFFGTDGKPIDGVLVRFRGLGDFESEEAPLFRINPDGTETTAGITGRIQFNCDFP